MNSSFIMPYNSTPLNQTTKIRSSSFTMNSSPQYKKCYLSKKNSLITNDIPLPPQSNKNAISKTHPHKNPIEEIQNYKLILNMEKNKENQVARRNSFKTIQPKNDDWMQVKIKGLEDKIQTLMNENKQLTQVLNQQLSINQSLKNQLSYRQGEVKELEQGFNQNEKVVEQLNIYQEVIKKLEEKIDAVINENSKLNTYIESIQEQYSQCKQDLVQQIKRNSILESKIIQSGELFQENQKLKNHLQQLQDHFESQDGILTNKQYYQQFEEKMREQKEIQIDLEDQIQYLEQMMQIDQNKMMNLEKRLKLVTKENEKLRKKLTDA